MQKAKLNEMESGALTVAQETMTGGGNIGPLGKYNWMIYAWWRYGPFKISLTTCCRQ